MTVVCDHCGDECSKIDEHFWTQASGWCCVNCWDEQKPDSSDCPRL